jgi:chitin elicitor receptor kinase 1
MQIQLFFFTGTDILWRLQKAAIKKMDMQATHEFLAELKVLTHVHHLNLVSDSFINIFLGWHVRYYYIVTGTLDRGWIGGR